MGGADIYRQGTRAIFIALCITLIFMVTQLIGGWIASSLALMADAAHMATDAASFLVALFAFWIAKRPASPRMSYGFYRAEILGAAFSCLALWVICGFLIYEAIRRMISPPEVKGEIVFFIALITLVFNVITMNILHRSSKESLNVRAAYLHVLSDLLGNFGVILAGGIIWLTGWDIVDPILTVLFTLLILYSTLKMLREATEILMEATPRHIDALEVQAALIELPEIHEIHDLHIWTVSSGRVALSAHLIATKETEALNAAHALLAQQFKIQHSTLQVEHPETFDRQHCFDTQKSLT